jgi:uncharacterized membrane protein (DUF106 family)
MVFGFPGYIEVLLVSVGISLLTVLISKFATDQNAIKNLKSEMKGMNARIKKAQKAGDTKEMNRLSGDMMKLSSKQLHMNMKPMMISLIFFMGVLWFFGAYYTELVVASPVSIPFVGSELGWFHWYIIIVLPGSFLFRKLLGVE